MKLKKLAAVVAGIGLAAAAGSAVQAAPLPSGTVLDGWKLETTSGSTSDIGRLNLVSGTATVEQQTDALGNVFKGAKFAEYGAIYSISYTKENVIGAGDTGAPSFLHTQLTISFSDVMGEVTALNPTGGFQYTFTSGNFLISAAGGGSATGSIIGIGGNAANTDVIGGVNGDSSILAQILDTVDILNFYDNGGNLLNPGFTSGKYLFEVVTNNNVTNPLGLGACSFDPNAICSSFSVASAGDAYITQHVPEPATLGLIGLGLFGVGAHFRRRRN